MESLDAGVFTYTELDPVTNGFYQQIISKKMLFTVFGPNTPRLDWKVGRIEAVYPGQD